MKFIKNVTKGFIITALTTLTGFDKEEGDLLNNIKPQDVFSLK